MARYGRAAANTVATAMRRRQQGTLRSGRSKNKVTSRKQAIAIGPSEARNTGAKVPARTKRAKQSPKRRRTSLKGA